MNNRAITMMNNGSDTENEEHEEFIMGQKIFFTEGGRTNKHSKQLLEQA